MAQQYWNIFGIIKYWDIKGIYQTPPDTILLLCHALLTGWKKEKYCNKSGRLNIGPPQKLAKNRFSAESIFYFESKQPNLPRGLIRASILSCFLLVQVFVRFGVFQKTVSGWNWSSKCSVVSRTLSCHCSYNILCIIKMVNCQNRSISLKTILAKKGAGGGRATPSWQD